MPADLEVVQGTDASDALTIESAASALNLADRWAALLADRWRLARWVALVVYVGLFVYQYVHGMPWTTKGLPLEREQFIGWMAVGAAVWSVGRDRKEVGLAIGGFGALALCFVVYDYTRGAIDNLWGNPTFIPQTPITAPVQAVHNAKRIITAEKALFFGHMPTEWLQDHLYLPSNQHPPKWEVITGLTYLTHFYMVYVIALFMWFRDKVRWLHWVRSLVTLITLGVTGYLLYPAAPPWMAAKFNLMSTTARPGTRSLKYVHLHYADRLWNKGQGLVNLVAAMPSLHMGFTVLVGAFFWRGARPWLRVILVAYPCLMLFTLVYGGEHYVLDCLVGAVLAWLAVWLNRRYVAWRQKSTTAPETTTAGEFPGELPAVARIDSVD